jgi:hypothetical protein
MLCAGMKGPREGQACPRCQVPHQQSWELGWDMHVHSSRMGEYQGAATASLWATSPLKRRYASPCPVLCCADQTLGLTAEYTIVAICHDSDATQSVLPLNTPKRSVTYLVVRPKWSYHLNILLAALY